jgi:hypothetical protein
MWHQPTGSRADAHVHAVCMHKPIIETCTRIRSHATRPTQARRGVRRGVSRRVEDGRRPPALQAVEGLGMAGPGETLGHLRPPPPFGIRPCVLVLVRALLVLVPREKGFFQPRHNIIPPLFGHFSLLSNARVPIATKSTSFLFSPSPPPDLPAGDVCHGGFRGSFKMEMVHSLWAAKIWVAVRPARGWPPAGRRVVEHGRALAIP